MNAFDPSAYGPAFAALLRDAPLNPLGPGRPDAARRPLLEALAGADAFRPRRVADRAVPRAVPAGAAGRVGATVRPLLPAGGGGVKASACQGCGIIGPMRGDGVRVATSGRGR